MQLAKLQHFIKSHWHNKKFQAQELYVLVKQDNESKYGWNYKTNKKWRKITLTDYATIIGYSSSAPAKINCLLKKANANVALYTNLIALYKRFVQLDIKTRMFKWLLSNKKETNDINLECLIYQIQTLFIQSMIHQMMNYQSDLNKLLYN